MSLSILIVDDESDVAELFRQRFSPRSAPGPLCAALRLLRRGEEALEKLDTDIRPDGLALLREIKQRWVDMPVMMVTAYGDNERRRRADDYGAAEFITKPVDFDLLKDRLRQLADGAA